MVGCVGSDSYGEALRQNLERHGVDVTGVRSMSGMKTGVAIILVDEPTGENRIVLSPEANHVLVPGDIVESQGGLGGCLVQAGGKRPDLLVMQLEIRLDTVLAALRAAKQARVDVLFNPAPAAVVPEDVYGGLAHLVMNETEAAMLGGVEVEVLDTEGGCERVAEGFVNKGVKNVVITLGGRGVYFLNDKGRKGLVPAEKAKVVDTTGAGDTFVGQYALEAVREGFEIEKAVRKSQRAAKLAVERKGAQDSIPWKDEVV